ncbi:unnamed protein product [Caretta caretta]
MSLSGQMLIIVSTLVSLLHPVLSAMSGALRWEGLEHWFFLLGLRLLALYFASAPWENARDDLACAWSRSQEEESRRFCTSVCYNRHFLNPVMPTWGFSFLIALLPITIMRMMYPQEDGQGQGREEDTVSTRPNMAAGRRFDGQSNVATKPKLAGEANTAAKSNMAAEPRPVGDSNMAAPPKLVDTTNTAAGDNTVGLSGVTGPPAGPNMAAQPPWHAGVFTVCLAVLLATEASFLWALLAWQLPMVSGPTFPCFPGTPACPPALECTIWGQADKRMALGSLALTACVSILVCLGSGGMWLGRATCCRLEQDVTTMPGFGDHFGHANQPGLGSHIGCVNLDLVAILDLSTSLQWEAILVMPANLCLVARSLYHGFGIGNKILVKLNDYWRFCIADSVCKYVAIILYLQANLQQPAWIVRPVTLNET